jgi:hypothetical protein
MVLAGRCRSLPSLAVVGVAASFVVVAVVVVLALGHCARCRWRVFCTEKWCACGTVLAAPRCCRSICSCNSLQMDPRPLSSVPSAELVVVVVVTHRRPILRTPWRAVV